MKKELNFYYDKPTINGHIYPKELILRELNLLKGRKIPVFEDSGNTAGLKKIGEYKDYEDSGMKIDVHFEKYEEIKEFVDKGNISVAGWGSVDENGVVKDDFELLYFFLTNDK